MLPDLTSDGTRRIVACGSIVSENPAISEWFKQQRFLIASYTKGKAKHFVRLISGGGRRATHFHLEVELHSWFRSGLPKAKSRISEVNEIVEKLEGQKTELELSCDFSLPFARLPEGGPIRVLSSETRMGRLPSACRSRARAQSQTALKFRTSTAKMSREWQSKNFLRSDFICK
jgi:hypothetical protein